MSLFNGPLLVFLQPLPDHLLKRTDGRLGPRLTSGVDGNPGVIDGLANRLPAVMSFPSYLRIDLRWIK